MMDILMYEVLTCLVLFYGILQKRQYLTGVSFPVKIYQRPATTMVTGIEIAQNIQKLLATCTYWGSVSLSPKNCEPKIVWRARQPCFICKSKHKSDYVSILKICIRGGYLLKW